MPQRLSKRKRKRVKETGKQIEKQNNRPAVDISVREFDITHSNFSYTDKTTDPNYRLFFSDTEHRTQESVQSSDGRGRRS